jgi:hypothetical protein
VVQGGGAGAFEGTAAAGGLHFGWFVLAIGVIALGVSYVQAHRGTPGFAASWRWCWCWRPRTCG